MENRPKKSLSLRKQGQKKLNFAKKAEGQGADPSSAPQAPGGGADEDRAVALPASSSTSWLSGLCNLGNTCYANSILQVLRFCPHFSAKVMTLSKLLQRQGNEGDVNGGDGVEGGGSENWQANRGALVIHLHKLWQRMANKEKAAANKSSVLGATKPQQFLSRLREEHEVFNNKMQQDAQEMLRYFLTNLHETLLEAISSLPPRPEVPTTPTMTTPIMQEGPGWGAIDVAAYASLSNLATRKRKLPQERKGRCKVSKTLRRKSASSTKAITNYLHNATPANSKVEEAMHESQLLMNEGLNFTKDKSQLSMSDGLDSVRDKPRLSYEDLDFVKEIFQGELVSQTRCYECDGRTRRTEAFLDVSLAVSSPGFPGFSVDDSATPHSSRTLAREMSFVGPFSLSRVLSQFCLRERLRGDNKYHCEGCGRLAEAERSVMFGRLPLVVTLHLNRFATHAMHWTSSGTMAVNKIGGNVAVPLAMHFSAWCTEDCVRRDKLYHLIAVVFHTGSSCSTGHYTACVRGKECRVSTSPAVADWIKADTDWVEFDDELVTLISQEELTDRLSPITPTTAYILFYSADGV